MTQIKTLNATVPTLTATNKQLSHMIKTLQGTTNSGMNKNSRWEKKDKDEKDIQ